MEMNEMNKNQLAIALTAEMDQREEGCYRLMDAASKMDCLGSMLRDIQQMQISADETNPNETCPVNSGLLRVMARLALYAAAKITEVRFKRNS